jgi:predicted transcriptional regulator
MSGLRRHAQSRRATPKADGLAVYIPVRTHDDESGGFRVAMSQQAGEPVLEGELLAVADAAGSRLRAETDQDDEAARAAADALLQAAAAAMAAGRSLTEIAGAEAHGKETVRHALRADALKLVERTGNRAREMQLEHYRAIARSTRLGLPMREIAQAAGVTHGTIRAINNRLAGQAAEAGSAMTDETEPGTPAPEEGHEHEGHEQDSWS